MRVGTDLQDHIPTLAPIAAVGSPAWDVFLSPKMHYAISAFARVYEDLNLVDEHSDRIIPLQSICTLLVGDCTNRHFVVNLSNMDVRQTQLYY